MASLILTAQVEDGVQWEEAFRTHGDLFRSQTVTSLDFAVNDNEVALYVVVDDLDTYMEILDSPATHEAMEFDGVKRETVKAWVLDRTFDI